MTSNTKLTGSPKPILLTRRSVCAGLIAAPFALARADTFPSKPITLIVPFPPGGVTDLVGRKLGDQLSKNLGQSIIIDNRPGAGTTLGAGIAAKARPDGYTLLMGVAHHTIASSVYKKLPYDFQKDFEPITTVATVGSALTINPAVTQANSLNDLIRLAKAAKVPLTYGSNGNGTLNHIIGSQFQMQTGVELVHVPYKGSAPLVMALLSGEVNISFDSVPPVLDHIKSQKLKPLAALGKTRNPLIPDVPTFGEQGQPGFEYDTWNGILAPTQTPAPILKKLNEEILKVVRSQEFVTAMTSAGLVTLGSTPEEFRQKIADEKDRFSTITKRANIVVE